MVATPDLAEQIANKATRIISVSKFDTDISMPGWLVPAIAVTLATQFLFITITVRMMGSYSVMEHCDQKMRSQSQRWSKRLRMSLLPSAIWLIMVAIAFGWLHDLDARRQVAIVAIQSLEADESGFGNEIGQGLALTSDTSTAIGPHLGSCGAYSTPSALGFALIWVLTACVLVVPSARQTAGDQTTDDIENSNLEVKPM
jgi:hypothetical protein